jgi:hypothetical protein
MQGSLDKIGRSIDPSDVEDVDKEFTAVELGSKNFF